MRFPISPENTSFFWIPFSSIQTSMEEDPNRWPASINRILIPSATMISLLYSQRTKQDKAPTASSISYSGSTGSRPARFPLRFFHSASNIWICALSRSMISHRSAVDAVEKIWLWNPFLYNNGSFPEWSICACVSKTISISEGFTGNSTFSKVSGPCSIPQSIRILLSQASNKKQLPVTSCVAPKKVSFIGCTSQHYDEIYRFFLYESGSPT